MADKKSDNYDKKASTYEQQPGFLSEKDRESFRILDEWEKKINKLKDEAYELGNKMKKLDTKIGENREKGLSMDSLEKENDALAQKKRELEIRISKLRRAFKKYDSILLEDPDLRRQYRKLDKELHAVMDANSWHRKQVRKLETMRHRTAEGKQVSWKREEQKMKQE